MISQCNNPLKRCRLSSSTPPPPDLHSPQEITLSLPKEALPTSTLPTTTHPTTTIELPPPPATHTRGWLYQHSPGAGFLWSRPMLSLLFQYLGSSLCHTSLFLLNRDAYQAYKDIERYVRMSWIKDTKVKYVPRAVGFDHTPEHHIHKEEGIRLLTTSLEEFVQVVRLYWESEVGGEKDRRLKKLRSVGKNFLYSLVYDMVCGGAVYTLYEEVVKVLEGCLQGIAKGLYEEVKATKGEYSSSCQKGKPNEWVVEYVGVVVKYIAEGFTYISKPRNVSPLRMAKVVFLEELVAKLEGVSWDDVLDVLERLNVKVVGVSGGRTVQFGDHHF